MAEESLRRRALPVGLALGLVSLAGVVADIVATSQILVLGGADSLLVLYPLSGVGLAIPTILLTPVIDRWARLAMLRRVGLALAIVYVASLATAVAASKWWPATPLPLVAVSVVWIMAAIQNYMYPMLLWSLAADLFNVNESKRINGWIASWAYVGRVTALGITVVTPFLLERIGIPLIWLLVIPPAITGFIAIYLPIRLRHSSAAKGLPVPEGVRESLSSGLSFVREVPVWTWLVIGSVVTFSAASAISLGISAASDLLIGANAAALQAYLGGIQLVAALLCLVIQRFVAVRLTEAIGLKGTLLVFPLSVVVAGLLLGASLATHSLWLLAAAAMFWRVPAWSIDQNARSAALGFVPDQRRARVSLILVLATFALTWILCAVLASPGLLVGPPWLLGAIPAVVGAIGLIWWARLYRHWDASMLNWRLRRRKRMSVPGLDDL